MNTEYPPPFPAGMNCMGIGTHLDPLDCDLLIVVPRIQVLLRHFAAVLKLHWILGGGVEQSLLCFS